MTWERFLLLRAWAKYIAWHEGCTVALVGSALSKTMPRDIDVALIWPLAEFEAMFGPLPTDQDGHKHLWDSWDFQKKRLSLYISAQQIVRHETRIDVRLCPDCWWPEKDRLVLATPCETEPPNSWEGVEFIIRKVVRAGEEESSSTEGA